MAYYEDIIYDNNQVKCALCYIYIKDDDYLIQTHINSDDHRDLEVKRSLLQNSVVIKGNNFYCTICDNTMDKYGLEEHLISFKHKSIIEEVKVMVDADGIFIKLPEEPNGKANIHSTYINCILCDCPINFTLEAVKLHIYSHKHRIAKSMALQPLNGIFSIENNNDFLWCKICRLYFDNYIETIFEHVDSKDHKLKLTKILNLIKGQNITIEKFLMDPKEDKAHCMKCNKWVACNVDNLERYIKGKSHNAPQN